MLQVKYLTGDFSEFLWSVLFNQQLISIQKFISIYFFGYYMQNSKIQSHFFQGTQILMGR